MGMTGRMIRQARRQAGLTQTQLAARTGIPQSVTSAYEAGRREPSVAAFRRLGESLGCHVALVLAPRPEYPGPERVSGQLADVLSLVDSLPFAPKRGPLRFPVVGRP